MFILSFLEALDTPTWASKQSHTLRAHNEGWTVVMLPFILTHEFFDEKFTNNNKNKKGKDSIHIFLEDIY